MKLKTLLQKYVINNIGYKILAVLFAFILWLVVLNITDPDYTKTISNIKVQVVNEQSILDGTHVYTISSGETTSVNVTGKRSIISNLSANDFLVTADLAQLSITNAAPISVELVGDKLRYAGQITMVPKDTTMIINLEDMTSRVLQVDVEYKGEPYDDIVIDEANISPKKVTISAPESITNSADKIVVTASYGNIKSDTTMYLNPVIRNVSGNVIKQEGDVSLDEDQITVEFKVSYKKDVPIKVSTSGTVKDGYVLQGIELSQDTIAVKGSKDDINSLYRIGIPGDIVSIEGASRSFEVEVDVTPYLPEGVTVYGESPTVTITVDIAEEQGEVEETAPLETTEEETTQEPVPLDITGVVTLGNVEEENN